MFGRTKLYSVNITNTSGRRIKAKVDCDRSISLVAAAGASLDSSIYKGSISTETEYDAFHIVPTAFSFTTIGQGATQAYHPTVNNDQFAYLTITVERDDGSWEIYCENHQITKHCDIRFGKNVCVRQKFSLHTAREEHRYGRIVVYNLSSKKIWAHVDTDKIERKTATATIRIENKSKNYSLEARVDVRNLVYYRAQQGVGYTQVNNGGADHDFTVFYVKIQNNQFFLSLDYEDKNGQMIQHCVHHPEAFLIEKGISWNPFTPHVYVENDGQGIKFYTKRRDVYYHSGY